MKRIYENVQKTLPVIFILILVFCLAGCTDKTTVIESTTVNGVTENKYLSEAIYTEGIFTYETEDKTVLIDCDTEASGRVVIPETVEIITPDAFDYCYSIKSLVVPNTVKQFGDDKYAFYGILNVEYDGDNNHAPWGAKSLNGYIDGDLVFDSETKTIVEGCYTMAEGRIVIPEGIKKVNSNAFDCCYFIKSLAVPDTVKQFGDDENSYVFCSILNVEYDGENDQAPWGANCLNGYFDGDLVLDSETKTIVKGCNRMAEGQIIIPEGIKKVGHTAFEL